MSAGTDMSAKNADTTQDNAAHGGCPATTCYASSCGRVTLYHADNLTVLPDLRADLVVTSPPYNLGGRPWEHLGHWKAGDITGGKGKWENGCDANGVEYGEHQDAMPWAEYVEWQRETLRALWNCLGDAGAIYYNHKPRVIGLNLSDTLALALATLSTSNDTGTNQTLMPRPARRQSVA